MKRPSPIGAMRDCTVPGVAPPHRPLEAKTILFGVTGGIAAYKAADYARQLHKLGARVIPVLTENARKFVTPLTFAALTGEPVHYELFAERGQEGIPHIALARAADLFLVAPATADFLARAAHGMADDLLSTLLLAYSGPVLLFPSMNPAMWTHLQTKANMERLGRIGYRVVAPAHGGTACGEEGQGRLPDWPVLREETLRALTPQSLAGHTVLISAGPTREPIDPVRYISNRSSGIMGYAMARVAFRRGARVLLVSGPASVEPPLGVELLQVFTAREMADAMDRLSVEAGVIVMTAAVADYTPVRPAEQKIKKGPETLYLDLTLTPDILSALVRQRRGGQVIVGFCAETEDLLARALEKVQAKGVDLLVANDVSQEDAGFDVPTNRVLIVSGNGDVEPVPLLEKEVVAEKVWDRVQKLLREGAA